MGRNGLVVAAGVIAIVRGVLGIVIGLVNFSTVNQINDFVPGYTQIFFFELVLSVAILIIGIYAIVKANDPGAAATIRTLGIVIVAAGVVDAVWTLALAGWTPGAIGGALGSLAALALIGGLFIAGARRLGATATA